MKTSNHSPADIRGALAHALASRSFARAARARALLKYLVEAKLADDSARLKESSIAVDVFGRAPTRFDGDTDGIVRVSINRLRLALTRYYGSDGDEALFRFEIPRGSYAPVIRRSAPGGLPSMPRILVLPLANFTGKPDNDALCDGLTEDLIDALAQLSSVRVLARTSSFKFKAVSADIRTIAREVAADAVLEGSIQEVGPRLRLTAQMVVAGDGTHLWSHSFEADAENRAQLQGQLIDLMQRSIVNITDLPSTATKTGKGAGARGDAHFTSSTNAVATAHYHRGLYAFRQDTVAGFAVAEKCFVEAVRIDPGFARAHAALARTWWARGNAGVESLSAAAHRALATSRRAFALAPSDPMVLSAHGHLVFFADYDPPAALTFAVRAIRHGPHVTEAHLLHAKICTYLRRFEAARKSLEIARSLDPLSLDPLHGEVALAIVAHEYPRALVLLDELITREPNSSTARWNRGHVLRKLGEFDACDEEFASGVARWPETARYGGLINSLTRASAGDLVKARELREQALAEIPWAEDAMVYGTIDALLGDEEGVLRAWEYAVGQRDPYVYLSFYHEEFDPWREHPRFVRATAALKLHGDSGHSPIELTMRVPGRNA